jgi:hypothetical protein
MPQMTTLYHKDDKGNWGEIAMYAIDAAEALKNDPEHYAVTLPASNKSKSDDKSKG